MDVSLPGTGVYIDGEYREGIERFPVCNPATNEQLTAVAEAGEPGVNAAVASNERALADWQAIDADERREHLLALADAIRDNSEWLAELETVENGRPISQSRSLVTGAARYFEYYAGMIDKIEGETIPVPGEYLDYTVREPLGVTGHLVPWNVSLKLGTPPHSQLEIPSSPSPPPRHPCRCWRSRSWPRRRGSPTASSTLSPATARERAPLSLTMNPYTD